jgi:putative spermidine/putrescine transport system permease protein
MKRQPQRRPRPRSGVRGWIVVLSLLIVFVLPVVIVALSAFAARWATPDILPSQWSLRGVDFLLQNVASIATSVGSSVAYSMTVVVLSFSLCVFPASVLGRYEFPGRIALEVLLLSPVLVPAITWSMGIHFTLLRVGLANRFLGVVIVLTAAAYPYMLRALIAGFQQIHPDVDACAANLGASLVRRMVRVHIPLLLPAIVAGGSVVFLVAFSEYFLVFLIGGGGVPSFSGYLFPFLSGGDRTISSVLTLLFLVIPMLLFTIIDSVVRRFFRRRLM